MPRPTPDFAIRAQTLKKGEVQRFFSNRRRDSIMRALAAVGCDHFNLARAKDGAWLLWREPRPDLGKAKRKRVATQAQLDALAKGRKLSPLKLKAKPKPSDGAHDQSPID